MSTGPRPPSYPLYLESRYFGSLDGLRCFCILAVIWHHVPTPPAPAFFAKGFLGVDMFFVLSGFLIVTLMLRERRKSGHIDLKNFYARRTLRIFPVYYLMLALMAASLAVLKPNSETAKTFFHNLPYLATYTNNWVDGANVVNLGIAWSLATEEQFYLLWPAVEKYLKPKAVLGVLAAVLAVNQLVNFGVLDPLIARVYGRTPEIEILDVTFTPIALGVLLAHALDDRRGYAAVAGLVGWRAAPAAVAAALLALIAAAPGDISGLPRLAIQLGMCLLLASVVVREDHVARGLLSWGPVRRIGLISYGMYLYHLWGLHAVRLGLRGVNSFTVWAYFPATVLATVAIAEVSFRYFETPILRLKSRFGGAGGARPAPAPDAASEGLPLARSATPSP